MSSIPHASGKSYVVGYAASLLLTVIPLGLLLLHVMSFPLFAVCIVAMAVLQLLVQLFFFMHIRDSEKPSFNVWALALGGFIVVVIVAASAWIMTFNSQVQ
jgi:cytochrome o ubiquinol oxidase operon protein cyoD